MKQIALDIGLTPEPTLAGFFRLFGVEDYLADSGAGGGRQAGCQEFARRIRLDGRVQKLLQRRRIDALDRFLAARDGQPARIFCTYTAMMTLRRILAERSAARPLPPLRDPE